MPLFRPGTETRDKEISRSASGPTALTVVAKDCTVSLLKVDDAVELGSGPSLIVQDLILDDEWTHVRIVGIGDSSRCSLLFHPARH